MLDRRLQLLLDEQRYKRLARAARRRGVSVSRVIRDAIDRSLDPADDQRREAGRRVLDAPDMAVPDDPAQLKRELAETRSELP